MFSAGRILRQNRRLSSLPAGALLSGAARPRRKEKRKFRCYLPFMWSALAMSFLGIAIIGTGTAMCVAGWYLGHFSDDGVRAQTVMDWPNASSVAVPAAHGGLRPPVSVGGPRPPVPGAGLRPPVIGLSADMPPARGLAYAGPVVMSFGCFAVVFACVVVCETRDRVLETMEDRVRRGLPARPPGGIDADFYALVVEFRKRRVEKQRHRRKLLRRDDDDREDQDDDNYSDEAERNVGCVTPGVEYRPASSPLQDPTPSCTADFQSPTTTNDFLLEDTADDAQPILEQHLPTFHLHDPDEVSS